MAERILRVDPAKHDGIEQVTFDNTRQVRRILYRVSSYWTIGVAALRRGVSLRSMLVTKFPFWFSDLPEPASISVELTDACNLKCVYCNNPGFANPRRFMTDELFDELIARLAAVRCPRIRVGGGEPTVHPKFDRFSKRLAECTPFLSIVTNGQWTNGKTIETLLEHYQLIEISVDAGGPAIYESSRRGGSYATLVENIGRLGERKRILRSRALINIRLMVRPSTVDRLTEERRLWSSHCDSIMPQYVMKRPETDYEDDVFHSPQVLAAQFPRCTLPFKDLQIRANGDVPLCQVTGSASDKARKVIIGSIERHSITELWRSAALRTVRNAHRRRLDGDMEVCRGCSGR